MTRTERRGVPAEIETVRRSVEEWRATRRRWRAMPAELWEAAVRLARSPGVYRVARGVRVDYGALKARVVARAADAAPRSPDPGAGFVEIDAEELFGAPRSSRSAETVVELSARDGSRMTIRTGEGAGIDVASLVAAFWAGRP
jgi:hypothetical protein